MKEKSKINYYGSTDRMWGLIDILNSLFDNVDVIAKMNTEEWSNRYFIEYWDMER